MVVICHPGRLAARQAQGLWSTPQGLLGEPLLYHSNGMDNWAQWFTGAGVPRAAVTLSNGFDQVSILVRAVMADMGIAVLQRCLVRDELQAGRVAAPFPDLPVRIARGYHLCAPAQRRDHYALACFRQWLLDTASQDPDVVAAGAAP
ncbi:Glycine cleavage system transcriptional activator [compost metagenome]